MPMFRRRENPAPEPIERIWQLCQQPEKWPELPLDDLKMMLFVLCTTYGDRGRSFTDDEIAQMRALYAIGLRRLSRDDRLEVLLAICGAVERRTTGLSALLPFQHFETDREIIGTAALHVACVLPLKDDDPMTGPKYILRGAETEKAPEKRLGQLTGLFMLGDRRTLPLLEHAWGFLDDDEREEWCYTYSGGISAVAVEFFLTRLEELDAQADENLFIAVVGALASLPSEAETPVVQDLERKFPVNAPDGRPEISVIGEWSIKEYGRKIEPRLRTIMAREPKTLPQVLRAWGIPQDGKAGMTITVEQQDGRVSTLPGEVIADAIKHLRSDELLDEMRAAIAPVDAITFRRGEGKHLEISIEVSGARTRAHNFGAQGGDYWIAWENTNELDRMAGPDSPRWIELQPLLSALCAVIAPDDDDTPGIMAPGVAEIFLERRHDEGSDDGGDDADTDDDGYTIGDMPLERIAAEREKGWWLDLQDEYFDGSPMDETEDSVARREELVRDAMADVEEAAEARGMTIQFEHAITGLLFSVKSIYVMPSDEECDRITQFAKELASAFEFSEYTVHRLVP